MARKIALREELAQKLARTSIGFGQPASSLYAAVDTLLHIVHRANRLTKVKRAVVKAAKAWAKDTAAGAFDLQLAIRSLERTKGRK